MLRTRIVALGITALMSFSLGLGAAAPAQAAARPAAPTTSMPRCEGIFGINCKVPAAYKEIRRLTKKALATKDPVRRTAIIRYELLSLFGNVAMWGDRKKIVPVKDNFSREALDAILTNIPAPSNAVVRCYGDWMANHVATRGANNATIQNFYSLVTAIKDGKEAYGTIRGKVKSEQKYIDALGNPPKVLRMLRNDRMKELVKDTFGVDLDAAPAAPEDMADAYIRMILDSRQSVTQAQYSGSVGQLFQNIMGNGIVGADGQPRYTGCQSIAEPKPKVKYVTKTYTSELRGVDLLGTYGSIESYDSKHRGGCEPAGDQLRCTSFDSVNSAYGEHSALRVHLSIGFPAAVREKMLPYSKAQVQIFTSFDSLTGSVGWEYGERDNSAVKGEFAASGGQLLGQAALSGPQVVELDYFLRENTSATLGPIRVTYTYTTTA